MIYLVFFLYVRRHAISSFVIFFRPCIFFILGTMTLGKHRKTLIVSQKRNSRDPG